MFGFGSPFTSPTSFYRPPSRYGGLYEQPPCRCPDCYYRSGTPFNGPSMSTRRPPTEYGWPFSSPYTGGAYGPTDGWTAPRRRVAKPARKAGAPARKEPSVAVTPERGELADSLRGKAKETVPVSQEQQDDIVQKPLDAKEDGQQPECASPERASSSGSESDCITDPPHGDQSDSGAGPEGEPEDTPAMDDIIPSGDSPRPAPRPEDKTFRHSTMAQIAGLSEQARELQGPVMSFAGEAGSKEYLFLSESLMDLLLKLDLIESNGDREVRDARRSAVVMIQEILGLLEGRAKDLQPAASANAYCSQEEGDDEEQESNREEAMTDDFTEQGENEEETLDDKITEQGENEEEIIQDGIADHEEIEAEPLDKDVAEREE